MKYTKEQHDIDHDSSLDPKPGCEFCAYEVYRRTHRCFGDGSSSVPMPPKTEDTE